MQTEELILEDKKRRNIIRAPFDPLSGAGAVGERKEVDIPDLFPNHMHLPLPMLRIPLVMQIIEYGGIDVFCMKRYGECTPELRIL